MKENLTLEKNQQKEFEQVIAKYTVTAHYNNISNEERPILNVEKKGIRLHFLRYGLFDLVSDYSAPTNSYTSPSSAEFYKSIFINEEQKATIAKVRNESANEPNQQQPIIGPSIPLEEVIINHDIPDNENFNIARTPLRAGYVYMINDATPLDDFKEFRVDDYGMIYEIDWSKNKKDGKYLDQRKDDGKGMMYKILDRDDQTYCFAYSPAQWSAAYVNVLLTNQQKRDERCKTKVLCKGILKNEESNNISVSHYNDTRIVVEGSNPIAHKYSNVLHKIADEEQKEDEEGENTLLENMFITLDDPMGCADTMCVGIDREVTRLKALMISLQTGKSTEEVFPYLQKNELVPIQNSEKSKQIQYLHRLAQLTYDFVYNNHENTEEYNSTDSMADLLVGGFLMKPFLEKNGVKKSKLEKLLGVLERAEQRKVINSYRDDLGNFMKSEYYQNATDDYINSIADSIEDAKGIMAEHLIALGQYPNMYDRHLDLKTVYQPSKDKWYKPINATLHNENPELFTKTTKLLDYKIDFQDIITLSLTKKTVSNMRKILKAYANHSDFKGGYTTRAIHGKVSYFRDKNTKVATFKFRALEDFDQYLLENKKQLRLELEGKSISLKQFKKYWHIEYEKMTAKAAQQFIDEGKVTLNLKNSPKRFEQEIKKFYQSGALASVLLIIEGVFWAEAFYAWKKEAHRSNRIALTLASIKLGASITRLAEETKTYEKLFAGDTARKVKAGGKVLGIASSAISVYSLGNSALTSFSYRDTDAALAYGVATGLSGVFLAADVSALIASFGGASFLALGFWPAALVGGAIVVTLYLINKYLKDTELQAYFKNFPLSDYTLQPNTGELPYQYANRLLTNIEDSISGSGKYQSFKDLEVAFVELTDMLTPNYTQVEVLLPESQLKRAYNRTYHTSLHYTETYNIYVHRFKVHLYSAYPCTDIDDIDIKVWFYPNGIQPNAKRTEITTFIYDFPKPDPFNFDQKQLPSCSIDFAIPNDARYYYEPAKFGYKFIDAEVLFLIRVINNVATREYTPQTLHNNDRYTYVYMSVKQTYPGHTAAINKFFAPQTHYASPMNIKSIKPKQLTHEQALHKRNVFNIGQVNHLQSYKSEDE